MGKFSASNTKTKSSTRQTQKQQQKQRGGASRSHVQKRSASRRSHRRQQQQNQQQRQRGGRSASKRRQQRRRQRGGADGEEDVKPDVQDEVVVNQEVAKDAEETESIVSESPQTLAVTSEEESKAEVKEDVKTEEPKTEEPKAKAEEPKEDKKKYAVLIPYIFRFTKDRSFLESVIQMVKRHKKDPTLYDKVYSFFKQHGYFKVMNEEGSIKELPMWKRVIQAIQDHVYARTKKRMNVGTRDIEVTYTTDKTTNTFESKQGHLILIPVRQHVVLEYKVFCDEIGTVYTTKKIQLRPEHIMYIKPRSSVTILNPSNYICIKIEQDPSKSQNELDEAFQQFSSAF